MPAGTIGMGGTTRPAELAGTMVTADLVLHGWDLSQALGCAVSWDDAAVRATGDVLAGMAERGPGMGRFGPAVAIGDDATPLDRALGLGGRDPAWMAGMNRRSYDHP
jgi:uncharacterized protein (TIGR03086 family)